MAGAGYRNWSAGDIPTATQFDTFLQEQTVMVFASAAARDSALTAVVSEGMVAYLLDVGQLTVYNGVAWTPGPGSMVAYAEKTADENTFTSMSDIASLTVTFTAVNGVTYRITGRIRTLQAGVQGVQTLLLTDAANAQLAECVLSSSGAGGIPVGAVNYLELVHKETWSGSTGSVTRKLRLSASAGSCNVIAAAGRVGFILVEVIDV